MCFFHLLESLKRKPTPHPSIPLFILLFFFIIWESIFPERIQILSASSWHRYRGTTPEERPLWSHLISGVLDKPLHFIKNKGISPIRCISVKRGQIVSFLSSYAPFASYFAQTISQSAHTGLTVLCDIAPRGLPFLRLFSCLHPIHFPAAVWPSCLSTNIRDNDLICTCTWDSLLLDRQLPEAPKSLLKPHLLIKAYLAT